MAERAVNCMVYRILLTVKPRIEKYCPVYGEWKQSVNQTCHKNNGRPNKRASDNRNELKDYFLYEGALDFQCDHD